MAVRGTIRHRGWLPVVISLLFVAVGGTGAKLYVVDLMRARPCGVPCLGPDREAIFVSVAALLFGLVGLAANASGHRRAERPWDHFLRDPVTGRITQYGWMILAAVGGAAFLVDTWVLTSLRFTGDV